jgi:hypothetical protein
MRFTQSLLLSLGLAVAVPAPAAVHIVVSVDWEGRSLDADNLAAMTSFRDAYPDIPLQHFLNAAYFTKTGASASDTAAQIRSVLRPGDEHGLHIHGWRSLMTASSGPIDLTKCEPDCGHDVNITAYSEAELRKVIAFSKATLEKNGFDRPKSFRAGAWQADKKVFRALAKEGFTLDSSATDAEYLKERWGHSLLYPVTAKIWPGITATSQPYTVDLGEGLSIFELPNNGCLADYVSAETLLTAQPGSDIYVSIGFHQETAAKYLPTFRAGLDAIRAAIKQENLPVDFIVNVPTKIFAPATADSHANP